MVALFNDIGFVRWPLLFSLMAVITLTLWSTGRLVRGGAEADLTTKASLDAVLFWGGFALLTGILGTVLGIILAAQSVEAAGAVSSTLLWGGIKISLLSAALGFMIMVVAALAWFPLQWRWRMLFIDEVEGHA